ncbi:MAG: DUF5043 domain-containing protein [Bacteroides sp.]|nr:DUF5043 domain-containing protein [Bacteroides sp.]
MKRIALILIYNLYVSFICAQTNYYLEDKTFNEDGYTYQADVIGIMVQLYNQDNQWVGRSPKYKVDGSPFFQPEYGYIESYDEESWLDSEKKMSTIANSTLTSMEKDMVKGREFTLMLHINSTTGKVDDVMFSFSNLGPFASIPVSTYRKMELQIKDQLFYNLTDDGRKLTYIFTWNSIEF